MKITSSAFFSPELARYHLDTKPWAVQFDDGAVHRYTDQQLLEKFGVTEATPSTIVQHSSRGSGSVSARERQEIEVVIASPVLDIWQFGLLLLQLITPENPTLWLSTLADNMLRDKDMRSLAYFWDIQQLAHFCEAFDKTGKEWSAAADLVFWCLKSRPDRRPQSMTKILQHRFFNESGNLRFLETEDERWPEFQSRQAAAFHSALEAKNIEATEELLANGTVDISMIDTSIAGSTIHPLERAVFTGKELVVIAVLRELPDDWPKDVKQELLDRRCALKYTPYLLACRCGFEYIAKLLVTKGCSTELKNSAKKTGKRLQEEMQLARERAQVAPWNRGDLLHLCAKNLESFLQAERAMEGNEHVRAGKYRWYSKQIVLLPQHGRYAEARE